MEEKNKKEKKELSPKELKHRKKVRKKIIKWSTIVIIVAVIIIINKVNKVEISKDNSTINKLSKHNIATSISASGTVEASDTKAIISNMTGHRVKQVCVKVGDVVNTGDVICEFDVSDAINAKKKKKKKEADAKKQEKDVKESFRKEIEKSKNEAKSTIPQLEKELNDTKKVLDTANSSLEAAKKKLSDYEKKSKDNSTKNAIANNTNVVTSNVDAERTALSVEITAKTAEQAIAQANYDKAKEKLDNAKQIANTNTNDVINNILGIMPNSTFYNSLSNALSSNGLSYGDLSNLMSGVSNGYSSLFGSNLTNDEIIAGATVTATTSGTITSLNVEEDMIFSSTQIGTIENANSLCISSEIGEYDIPDIKEGMAVKIKTDATRNEELDGVVTSVAAVPSNGSGLDSIISSSGLSSMMGAMMPSSSSTSNSSGGSATYTVKIDINTPNDRLRLGMNAKLSIITEQKNNILSVPYDTIHKGADGNNYITIVRNDFNADERAKELKVEKMYNATKEKDSSLVPNILLDGYTKEVKVDTGIEGTYFIEINSSEIKEGDNIAVKKDSTANSLETLLNSMGADAGI